MKRLRRPWFALYEALFMFAWVIIAISAMYGGPVPANQQIQWTLTPVGGQ